MTDVHAHLAALPTPDNGCRMSRRMLRSPLFKAVAWKFGLPLDDPETANRKYAERLVSDLSRSESVQRAVVLGMDGVYDAQGNLDEAHTEFLISSDYLFNVAADHPGRLFPGVSINPMRKDALDELERCAGRGAVLVKTLPNTQMFNPGEGRFRPFYRAMAERRLPLLSHVGFEFTLIGQDQSVGNPERLIPVLEEGATVIAAHGCSHGLFVYEPHLKTMLDMVRRHPNFYVDLSALTLQNRVGMLLKIRRHPELFDRLVFGTDYPLPCFAYPALLAGNWSGYRRARAAKTPFDRHHRVLEALGIPSKDVLDLVRR